MNLVDSSCWLEYFAGSDRGSKYAPAIEDLRHLVVPTICLYEVFKKILIERGEDSAIDAIAHMRQGAVKDITSSIAINAAALSAQHKLPMADSIILATAHESRAMLWTQDEHFKGLEGVRYFPVK